MGHLHTVMLSTCCLVVVLLMLQVLLVRRVFISFVRALVTGRELKDLLT